MCGDRQLLFEEAPTAYKRIEHRDEEAERAATTGRRRIHDELVRGNPTRVERPGIS